MKKYIILLFLIGLFSCNDDFLNKSPLDQETSQSFFTTYENCRTYAWQFYAWYPGYGMDSYLLHDSDSDNGFRGYNNGENSYAWDKITKVDYTSTGSNGWYYWRIRSIHTMLDNLDNVKMNETDKAHWKSVCYFFKAQEYFRLVSRFGDVIWIEKLLTETDEDVLYGPTTPRVEVAEKILEMLLYARDNIKQDGDGANTINTDVVNALISRFGLFEGTWQKYHNVPNGNPSKYLQASFEASSALITKYPELHNNYNEVFNSYDLSGVKGVLLYKVYIPTKGHSLMRNMRSSESWQEASADMVQSYLCSDGKPIWTSSVYEGNQETGDDIMNIEFRNRDHRLYYSICPPYRVNTPVPATFWNRGEDHLVTPTGNPLDQEYIDLMKRINEGSSSVKELPVIQWNDCYVREQPHFRGRYQMLQGYNVTNAGYYNWKYYTPDNQTVVSDTDAPIFRMGEVMINHAEVAWELGEFDQAVADATINKLRSRAHIANMVVAQIDANFDPKRDKGGFSSSSDPVVGPADYEVDPVLWEIRRERRVELYAEGFRFDDLRRWGKGHYLNKRQFGAYVQKSDYENSRYVTDIDFSKFDLKIEDPTKDSGRIALFGTPNPGWKNKYYLYAIPINDLTMNGQLKQNPGYESK